LSNVQLTKYGANQGARVMPLHEMSSSYLFCYIIVRNVHACTFHKSRYIVLLKLGHTEGQ